MEFKVIPIDPSYAISECGTVFSYKSNKIINSHLDTGGYLRISFGSKKYTIHRLVCITYHGFPENEFMVINHKNGNKLDNHKDNLEWCTIKENYLHYLLYLKEYDEKLYSDNMSAIGVCEIYEEVSRLKIKAIRNNTLKKAYFSEEQYPVIYDLCRKKIPVRFISRKFENIPLSHIKSVYNFVNGRKVHRMSV